MLHPFYVAPTGEDIVPSEQGIEGGKLGGGLFSRAAVANPVAYALSTSYGLTYGEAVRLALNQLSSSSFKLDDGSALSLPMSVSNTRVKLRYEEDSQEEGEEDEEDWWNTAEKSRQSSREHAESSGSFGEKRPGGVRSSPTKRIPERGARRTSTAYDSAYTSSGARDQDEALRKSRRSGPSGGPSGGLSREHSREQDGSEELPECRRAEEVAEGRPGSRALMSGGRVLDDGSTLLLRQSSCSRLSRRQLSKRSSELSASQISLQSLP